MAAPNQEDVTLVLENFIYESNNLPLELAHLFGEIEHLDKALALEEKKAQKSDLHLQKWIRQHGSHTEHPKEKQYIEMTRDSHRNIAKIQAKKLEYASRAKNLVKKHTRRLEEKVAKLLEDQQITDDQMAIVELPPLDLNNLPSGQAARDFMRRGHVPPNVSVASARGDGPPERKRQRPNLPSLSLTVSAAGSRQATPGTAARRSATPTSAVARAQKGSRSTIQKKPPPPKVMDEEDISDEEDEDEEGQDDQKLYCTCQQVSFGSMVGCDNEDCPFEWFHWGCVGITEEPVGKWFCPFCVRNVKKDEENMAERK